MDNVRFHKSRMVNEIIESSGHAIFYLPPYSPFLNPIENMFSTWKENVRRLMPNNEQELMNYIENGTNSINRQMLENYYGKMMDYVRRGMLREQIL